MSATPAGASGYLTPAQQAPNLPFSAPSTPSNDPTVVGFIGLGNMGTNIARNLAVYAANHKQGAHSFIYQNRTRSKAENVVKEVEKKLHSNGGIVSMKVVDTVEELVKEADVIITSMGTDDAMVQLAEKISAAVKNADPGKVRIVVDTSTLYPSTSAHVDRILTANSNVRFVATPVFGPPKAAREAKLIIVLAGDYASKKKIAYLMVPAAGYKVIDLGGNVERAASFKLLGNAYIAGSIELLAETHTLAEKTGVGSEAFHSLLVDMFPAPPIVNYSKRILHDNFEGADGFSMAGGIKDVSHMKRLGAQYEVPLPMLDITHQHMVTAKALNANLPAYKRNDNMDWSALVAGSRVSAGMDPFESFKTKKGPMPE